MAEADCLEVATAGATAEGATAAESAEGKVEEEMEEETAGAMAEAATAEGWEGAVRVGVEKVVAVRVVAVWGGEVRAAAKVEAETVEETGGEGEEARAVVEVAVSQAGLAGLLEGVTAEEERVEGKVEVAKAVDARAAEEAERAAERAVEARAVEARAEARAEAERAVEAKAEARAVEAKAEVRAVEAKAEARAAEVWVEEVTAPRRSPR